MRASISCCQQSRWLWSSHNTHPAPQTQSRDLSLVVSNHGGCGRRTILTLAPQTQPHAHPDTCPVWQISHYERPLHRHCERSAAISLAKEAPSRRRDGRVISLDAIANWLPVGDTTLLIYCEPMLYNGFTGDKSVPSTRFRAFTANQHQVAAGLCRRLSPTTLIGAVPSATAPATARHASGMENESKNPSAPPPAVGLIPLGTWSNTPNHRLYIPNIGRKPIAASI